MAELGLSQGADVPSNELVVAPSRERSGALYEKLRPGPGRPAGEVADHQRARLHSAMLEAVASEAVASRGYSGVTMRELTRLSGVSSRAFYQHYASKEDCFLHTHELLVRRLVRRILAAQRRSENWRDRLGATIAVFMNDAAGDPRSARFILIDGYSAGPAARDQIYRTEQTLEACLAQCFDRNENGISMPSVLVRGITAAMVQVVRSRVLVGKEEELSALAEPLAYWALALYEAQAAQGPWDEAGPEPIHHAANQPMASSPSSSETPVLPVDGNRRLLLTAMSKLAAANEYGSFSVRDVCEAAGTTSKCFTENFESLEACFAATFEEWVRKAFADLSEIVVDAPDIAPGSDLAAAHLCERVAADPLFARICFEKVFVAGAAGVEARYDVTRDLIDWLTEKGNSNQTIKPIAIEASISAAWGLLRHCVASGRARQADRLSPTIAFILRAATVD